MRLAIPKGHYDGRGFAVTGSSLVNMYAEKNEEDSESPFSLYHTPGLLEWLDTAVNAPIHGMATLLGNLYVVAGNQVIKIAPDKTMTTIGTLGLNSDRVFMASNGQVIAALTEEATNNFYVISPTAVLLVTDTDYEPASALDYMDGYHILSKRDSGQFFITGILAPSTIDALDFASAEARPDNIRRPFAFNDALLVFGEKTIEPLHDSGAADFPFEPIPGTASTNRGCGAKHSVVAEDNTVYFYGDDGILYKMNGYAPERISTHAIEQILAALTRKDDLFGFVYTYEGHKFTHQTNAEVTLVYDPATNELHKRQTRGLSRWRGNNCVDFGGKTLVGDYANGKIYEVSGTHYFDGPDPVTRIIETPTIWADDKRVGHYEIMLKVEAGVGLANGQGEDPQIAMQYSDDGGRTWSNEQWRSLGRIGKRNTRLVWRRLGRSRERIYRFSLFDPVPLAVHGLYGSFRVGRE